jgi:drug/metabolite transporter (DMT)-like permease
MKKPQSWQVGIILTAGVLAVSTSAILIRLCFTAAQENGVGFSLFIAASRLTLASLFLLPAWVRLRPTTVPTVAYYYAGAAGACLALHFATWITSLSLTSIAAATTLVTTNPIWVALICWLWFQEKPTKLTVIGMIIALLGGVMIALGDGKIQGENTNFLGGDFLALAGAWTVSFYLLLGREAQRHGLGVGSYSAIAYTTAAVLLLPLPLLFGSGYLDYPNLVYGWVLLMAILPQLVGHTSFNWSIRWLSPTVVTLAVLGEPIASSLLGWLIFAEIPSLSVLGGGIILLLGVATAVIGTRHSF